MRDGMKLAARFAALYAAIAGVSLGPLFAVGGISDTTFSVAIVTAIALIPVTAIVYSLVGRVRFSAPRAASEQAEPAAPPPSAAVAGRQHFEFAFAAWNGIDSGEAVERLAARLSALGIEHRYARTVAVRDGDVRWEVAPVPGALRITGWVEAPCGEQRMMVMAAIEEFLIDELGIRLEKLAA